MKNKLQDQISDQLALEFPKSFKAAYPRNIETPKGYTDPRHYGSSLVAAMLNLENPAMRQVSHINGVMTAAMLISHKMPTYFVADDFAFAAANTNLPGDFKFQELLWPLPAQLFVLSDHFCDEYYGGIHAPFVSVCRVLAGPYPQMMPKMPEMELGDFTLTIPYDKILMDFPICYENDAAIDYNCNYPMTMGIEAIKDAPWVDSSTYENVMRGFMVINPNEITPEREQAYIQKAIALGIKLLLAVAARPALVEHGKLTRQQVVHRGRVLQPSITSPNFIGRRYVIQRRTSDGTRVATGPRQAPKFRYRRGHWTWQAKNFKRGGEFVSVGDMPRKPDPTQPDPAKAGLVIDFDAAGEQLGNKFRACHERMWIEGWLFDDENQPK